jgi:hypothetical protein
MTIRGVPFDDPRLALDSSKGTWRSLSAAGMRSTKGWRTGSQLVSTALPIVTDRCPWGSASGEHVDPLGTPEGQPPGYRCVTDTS